MAFRLVSLLVATVLSATSALPGSMLGFPMLGGLNGMFNPLMSNMMNNQNQQQQGNPNQMTCIGADAQDPTSQIRLTLTPLEDTGMGMMGMGLGFGQGQPGFIDRDQGRRWRVDGMMLPTALLQQPASFSVGAFEGGRTHGTCQGSALGRQILPRSQMMGGLGGLGGVGGLGAMGLMDPFMMGMMHPFGMGGFGPFGAMNPLLGGMQQQTQVRRGGDLGATTIMNTGPTVYSAIIEDVSYNQLIGGSIGVCQVIQDGICMGAIPYCCSIVKDPLPADKVYVDPTTNLGMGGGGAAFPLTGGIGGNVLGGNVLGGNVLGGGVLGGVQPGGAIVAGGDLNGGLL